METGSQVDALLDQMLHALAKHPKKQELEKEGYFGPGFFDGYEGESVWDETFTALSEREAQLQAQYYDLSGQAAEMDPYSEEFYKTYGEKIAEVYAQMVQVRQEMAEHVGYADYPSFAFEFYYGRDYTPKQAEMLMKDIQKQLVGLYHGIDRSELGDVYGKVSTEDQTFSYVKSCAKNIGGVVSDAFNLMEKAGLYDISYSTKKYDASFEIFISDYYEPYVFVNPTGMVRDQLTFVHEFGHFANDYASFGTTAGIDVAEFFSQGMEYLSLDYADGGKAFTKMKMADSLGIYVEQTMYAYFEQVVYNMDAPTKEEICDVFEDVVQKFGFEDERVDSMAFVNVPHFFISPMYVISYVVSNDAALQLYQLEQAQKGAGVSKYVENLDTVQGQFLAFVKSAGLESPFAVGRIDKVRKTFEAVLK
jgi:oligoendopeptidase F